MGFFSIKKEVNLEDFCRDFYDNLTFLPLGGKIDGMDTFAEFARKTIAEADPKFADVDLQKLKNELTFLRFELFALAWTHRFINGITVIAQSVFTKHYLQEKGGNEIWAGMAHYNGAIEGATLHWLTSLGKVNMPYNYRMKQGLADDNSRIAKEMKINEDEINEIVQMVNNRSWSENAWRYKFTLTFLQAAFYKNISINPEILNNEALTQGAIIIKGLYDGAKQSLDNIKIKN